MGWGWLWGMWIFDGICTTYTTPRCRGAVFSEATESTGKMFNLILSSWPRPSTRLSWFALEISRSAALTGMWTSIYIYIYIDLQIYIYIYIYIYE
jgi:hypothetical protein